MQELIKELVEKAGLSEEDAQKSVDVTMEFIKGKVPPAFQDKIEDLMNGNFDLMSLMSAFMGGGDKSSKEEASPLDMLKGMFGK